MSKHSGYGDGDIWRKLVRTACASENSAGHVPWKNLLMLSNDDQTFDQQCQRNKKVCSMVSMRFRDLRWTSTPSTPSCARYFKGNVHIPFWPNIECGFISGRPWFLLVAQRFPHIAQPHIRIYNKAISRVETFISILLCLSWTVERIVWTYCISSTLRSTHTSWPREDLSSRGLRDSKRCNWSTSTPHTNFYLHSFRKFFSKQGSSSWIPHENRGTARFNRECSQNVWIFGK